MRLAHRGRLLLQTPGLNPFRTCFFPNVEVIFSCTCHFSELKFQTSFGISSLPKDGTGVITGVVSCTQMTVVTFLLLIFFNSYCKLSKKVVQLGLVWLLPLYKEYKFFHCSSPHLVQFRERIKINDKPITQRQFANVFWKVHQHFKESEVLFFRNGRQLCSFISHDPPPP